METVDNIEILNTDDIVLDEQQVITEEANTASSLSTPQQPEERSIKSAIDIVSIANEKAAIDHRHIFAKLLQEIQPINLRAAVGIKDDNTKLPKSDVVVQIIKAILNVAKKKKWNLCKRAGFVYIYNGEFWVTASKEDLEKFLGEAALKLGAGTQAEYFRFREELLKQFMAAAYLPKPNKDNTSVKVNFLNGTFIITPENQELREFKAEDFMTYQLPFNYDPQAEKPMFEDFLSAVQPDFERQKILAEYLGYLFIRTSHLKLEKILLIYGTGSNGKSVFFEVVNALLGGSHNISNFSLHSLTSENGYYRAKLGNVLLNYASEINGKLESSIFKQLASGEPVEARLPYGDPFVITDYAKLIFNCNTLPSDTEQTYAYFRRFIIVPFEVTISEADADKELAKKIIQSELSGIFNWVLEGLRRLLVQKTFTESHAVKEQLNQFRLQSDSVAMFVNDEDYKPEVNYFMTFKLFYEEYKYYCKDNGYRECSARTFSDRIKKLGFQSERKGQGVVHVYTRDKKDAQPLNKVSFKRSL